MENIENANWKSMLELIEKSPSPKAWSTIVEFAVRRGEKILEYQKDVKDALRVCVGAYLFERKGFPYDISIRFNGQINEDNPRIYYTFDFDLIAIYFNNTDLGIYFDDLMKMTREQIIDKMEERVCYLFDDDFEKKYMEETIEELKNIENKNNENIKN